LVRVLFLGGLGRSGTTLLERVLGELPGVCPLGEVVHLRERDLRNGERCGCGATFSDCDFWRSVGEEAFGGRQPAGPGYLTPVPPKTAPTITLEMGAGPGLTGPRWEGLQANHQYGSTGHTVARTPWRGPARVIRCAATHVASTLNSTTYPAMG
jgi:hypothetical protein